MKHTRSLLFILLSALIALPAVADDDFGVWSGLEFEKKFSPKWSVGAEMEMRTEKKLESITRWAFGVYGAYQPLKYLRFSGGYILLHDHSWGSEKAVVDAATGDEGFDVGHGYWRNKHRIGVDVTGILPLGRFTFKLRERYQYTHKLGKDYPMNHYLAPAPVGYTGPRYEYNGTDFTSFSQSTARKHHSNTHQYKSRLWANYDIPNCPLDPYMSFELSWNMRHAFHLDENRLTVGADWTLNKYSRLSLSYFYQYGTDDGGKMPINVVYVSYKLTL